MAEKYPTNEFVDQPDSTSEESSCSSSDSSRSCSPEPLTATKVTKTPKEDKKLIDRILSQTTAQPKPGCIIDLKNKAKAMGIRGYSRLNKKDLENAINGYPIPKDHTVERAIQGGVRGASPNGITPKRSEPINIPDKVVESEPAKVVESRDLSSQRDILDQRAIVQDRLYKMKLADLKVMCKKGGITLSHYDKTKGKSVAKTRGRLIEDITAYCNKN